MLSGNHYLPVNGRVVSAESVKVGDTVQLSDGKNGAVSAVSSGDSIGLFNPQTMDGLIVVNGIVATCYTRVVDPRVADVLLAVPRVLYRLGVKEPLGSLFYRTVPDHVSLNLLRGRSEV
mmetsp:Transcript_1193/g.3687  ORF Transcript_1193/g.3687 Transcript_1193/m.3687 type:complete len:119 (-) Transcript_1193:317-673(-)